MENSSICNFNFNASNDLVCSVFVLERTDVQVQKTKNQENAIYIVIKGNGAVIINDKRIDLVAGTVFFVRKGETSFIERNDMEYAYIRFRGRRAEEYVSRLNLCGENRVYAGDERLIEFWTECLLKANDGNVDLLSESVLLYSLAYIQPELKKENDVVSRVVHILGEKFTDCSLSLARVAKEIGYNEKYISALFKNQKGVTYTEYLTELRISHAVFLAEQGINSVNNIALLSGFSDALYFSRIFKKNKGMSPKQFIQRLEEERKETKPSRN